MAKNSLYLPARGTIRQKLRSAFVRRNHKDLLFVRLFQDKRELLQLYNALNGTHYENEHDILKDFLSKHRNEVTKVLLTEYDARKQRKMDIWDAREEGRIEGLAEGRTEGLTEGRVQGYNEGREQIFQLMQCMEEAGEGDQVLRLTRDPTFLREMMEKYADRK